MMRLLTASRRDCRYLEAVFAGGFDGGDIARQLPDETRIFHGVLLVWGRLMNRILANPGVMQVCVNDNVLKEVISTVAVRLERCTRSLASYLSAKRAKFPNFYFVSDTALLELLSGNVASVTPHLSSLFDATCTLVTDRLHRQNVTGVATAAGIVRIASSAPHLTFFLYQILSLFLA